MQKQIDVLENRWKAWRSESERELVLRGPWPGWRRSYLLLALAFLLLALVPWIWAPKDQVSPSPAQIQTEGRVGEALLPGSTLFLDPGDNSPSAASVLRQKTLLRGLRPPTLDFPRPPHQGELARFENTVWSSKDINRLARAELLLRGLPPNRLDRQMQELVLQREIESAWLRREAELQGIRLPDAAALLRLEEVTALRKAGLSRSESEGRLLALLLASEIRNLELARRGDLRSLEAEWFQRWSPRTECFVQLPICSLS